MKYLLFVHGISYNWQKIIQYASSTKLVYLQKHTNHYLYMGRASTTSYEHCTWKTNYTARGWHPKITAWSNESVIVSLPLWRRNQLHCLWWWAQVPPRLCTPPPPFWVLLCERRWSPPVRSVLPAAFPFQFCGCWVCKIGSVVIYQEESFNYNEMESFNVREQWEYWGFMQMC